MSSSPPRIAIVGSGPTGLMACTHLAQHPHLEITLVEKRPALGRKLLIAGSSGLNISHAGTPADFSTHYSGWDSSFWRELFEDYGREDWIQFIEKDLGLETFLGTSQRYFVKEMKASTLVQRWKDWLIARGVRFVVRSEWNGTLVRENHTYSIGLGLPPFQSVGLALGGGSWEKHPEHLLENLSRLELKTTPFSSANCGFEVDWKEELIREAEGLPLKNIVFKNQRGTKQGELTLTRYGLEGTPIYFYGEPGACSLDLLPQLSASEIEAKLMSVRENLSPIRRVKQKLGLGPGALALLFHHTSAEEKKHLSTLVSKIKNFPLELRRARPLKEAISSRGGLELSEVTRRLELKKFPNVFAAGEMLNWHAPTGGFLIQAAISMGARIGREIRSRFELGHRP